MPSHAMTNPTSPDPSTGILSPASVLRDEELDTDESGAGADCELVVYGGPVRRGIQRGMQRSKIIEG